jgi:hypothetical protein
MRIAGTPDKKMAEVVEILVDQKALTIGLECHVLSDTILGRSLSPHHSKNEK